MAVNDKKMEKLMKQEKQIELRKKIIKKTMSYFNCTTSYNIILLEVTYTIRQFI